MDMNEINAKHETNVKAACEFLGVREVVKIVFKQSIAWRDASCNQESKKRWRKMINHLEKAIKVMEN